MSNIVYIDTRPGKSLFSPPEGVADYGVWLSEKYLKEQHQEGERKTLSGVAQKIHEVLQAKKLPAVVTLGPYAQEVATAITFLGWELGKELCVEVINAN